MLKKKNYFRCVCPKFFNEGRSDCKAIANIFVFSNFLFKVTFLTRKQNAVITEDRAMSYIST
jgi:hypothetical protein